MGNGNNNQGQSTDFFGAVSDTVTLAFKVVDQEVPDLPGQLLKAMQSDDVQNAIKKALQEVADSQIKPKAGTPPPLPDPRDFLKKLVTAGGTAVEQNVLKQIKDSPKYKSLEKSLQNVLDTLKKTPVGIWFDNHELLVYVIVGGVVLSGATAMYITRSGSAVAQPAFDFVKGKEFKIVKLGNVVLSASGTTFNPDKRELGGKVLASLNLKAVKAELSVTIQSADTKVQGSATAKVVVPLGHDFVTTFSGTADPTKKTVTLGLSLDATRAGVKVDLLATAQDGKLASGSVNLGTNHSIVKGIDLRPGVTGQIDAHNGMTVLGTLGVSF